MAPKINESGSGIDTKGKLPPLDKQPKGIGNIAKKVKGKTKDVISENKFNNIIIGSKEFEDMPDDLKEKVIISHAKDIGISKEQLDHFYENYRKLRDFGTFHSTHVVRIFDCGLGKNNIVWAYIILKNKKEKINDPRDILNEWREEGYSPEEALLYGMNTFLQEIGIATGHIISEDLFTALGNPEIIKPLVKRDFLNTDDFKTLEGIKSPNKAELKEIEFIEYSKHLLDFIYLLSKDKISLQDAHEILSKVNDIIEKLASKEQFNVLLPEIKTIERYLAGVDFDIEVKRQEKYVLLNEWDVSELSEEELGAIYEMAKEYLPFLENLPFYYNYKRYETHLKTSLNGGGSEAIQIAPQDDYYSEQCGIFLMRGGSNKNKQSYKLRVTTDEICTPHLIALSLQIGSYLKNKSFINTQQLHYHIHNMLFKLDIGDIECFDVSIFEKQFEELTRSLVLPLCNPKCNNGEHLNIPALNVLLTGVYGTGKTQSLKYLKQTNGFDINGEKYVLNANRICLTANEFFTLLTHQNESLLEYLIDLYHFTGLPALLFVEDIDTILQKADENDSVGQALTEFLEGSSLFPCKVISTTNYPERINPRHLRPNRFEKIVDFHIPKEKELREKIASQHVEKFFNNLIQDSEKNMIIEYAAEVSSGWTTSHVFGFIKECYSVYRIEQALRGKGIIINKDLLDDILNRYIVPKDDIREREHQHNEWLKGLKGKSDTELAEDDQKYVL